MKALIIVTVLAMATSAIAVPLSRQAKAAMRDNAHQELDREFAAMQKEAVAMVALSLLENLKRNALKKSVMQRMNKAEVEKSFFGSHNAGMEDYDYYAEIMDNLHEAGIEDKEVNECSICMYSIVYNN